GVYPSATKVKVIIGAHNVRDPDEPSQVKVQVKAFSHGEFDAKEKENDIALLRLEKAVLHTNVTIPVCLPEPNEKLPIGKTCFVSGWGNQYEGQSTSPATLQEVDATILDQSECRSVTNEEKMFCAGTLRGGKDACQGDSGGPLVCEINGRFTQYGVVSFGAGCGKMYYAGVYTFVSRYMDWIRREDSRLPPSRGYVEPYKNPDSEGISKPAGFSFPSGLEFPSGFQLSSGLQSPSGSQSPSGPKSPGARPTRPKPTSSGSSPSFDSLFQNGGLGGTGELGSSGGISGLGGFGGLDGFDDFGGFGGFGSFSSLGSKFPELGNLMDSFGKKPGKPGSKVTGTYTVTTYDGKGKPVTQTYNTINKKGRHPLLNIAEGEKMRQIAGLLLLLGIATAATYHCGKPVVPLRSRHTAERLSNRIVGGWEAAPHSIPWQVRVKTKKTAVSFFACGGSLIQFRGGNSTDLVLTAAHCFEEDGKYAPVSSISVVIGAHDLNDPDETTRRTIQALQYMHKDFESKTKENDIALVRLEKAVVHSKATIPVCLPKQGDPLPFGKTCFVSGWGTTSEYGSSSTVLRQVEVEVLQYDKCYKKLDEKMYFCAGIMAGGRDSCQGDSGGPLVCDVYGKFIQYGVISHGAGCARAGTPGVYTTLPSYINWLQDRDKAMKRSKGSVDPMKDEPSEKQPTGGRGPTNSFTIGSNSPFESPSFPSVPSLSNRPPSSYFGNMPNDIMELVNQLGRGAGTGSSGTYTVTKVVNGKQTVQKYTF
ncbi:hypothetical protein M514_05526, partial [Trichuris suis]